MGLDQSVFLQTLTYTVAASAADIRQDMEAIAQFDREAEQKQSFWTTVCIVGFVVAFLSIFLTAIGGALALLLLVPALIAGIVGGILLNRYKRINLDNSRYTLIKGLVTMLDRDLEPGTPINASLDFSAVDNRSKRVGTVPHPFRSGWKVDLFEDPWLKVRGRFTDNTRFQLMMTDLYRTAYGWKRGRSGKNKYKSKSKPKGSEIALTLNCSMRKYGALKVLEQEAQSAIQLPDGVRIKRFQVTNKGLHLAVKILPDSSKDRGDTYKTITMMLLSLYQILNLARVLSKPKSA